MALSSNSLSTSQWRIIAVSALAIGVIATGSYLWYGGRSTTTTKKSTSTTASAARASEGKGSSAKKVKGNVNGTTSTGPPSISMEAVDPTSNVPSPGLASPGPLKSTSPSKDLVNDKDALQFRASEESVALYPQDIFAPIIPAASRTELSQKAKNAGNEFYKKKAFLEAYDLYTQAIRLQPDAVFYSNRAACLANVNDYEGAVADCTESLKLEALYIKALNRRAHAFEKLDRNSEALNDYSVVCVMEQFKNDSTLGATDRILKKLGKALAQELMKTKKPRLPSATFISAYMDSFHLTSSGARGIIDTPARTESDKLVREAFIAIDTRNWDSAMKKVGDAIVKNVFGDAQWESLAYNVRGTFNFLMGKVAEAGEDFERAFALVPTNVDTIIKRASIFMEKADVENTLAQLDLAESTDAEFPDLYYHRGQVRFLTGDLAGASEDYNKAIKIDPAFVYGYIQLGVSQYKLGNKDAATATFMKAARKFEKNAEVFNYYGEILLDMQDYDKALLNFDKSTSLDSSSPLPYINKAILYLQSRSDPVVAEVECRKAVSVDPLCDIAYTQLAQLLLHQNKVEEAIENYNKAVEVTRTEQELANAISCREAAVAQLYVIRNYPDIVKMLSTSSS